MFLVTKKNEFLGTLNNEAEDHSRDKGLIQELIHVIFVVTMYGRNDNPLRFMLGHPN